MFQFCLYVSWQRLFVSYSVNNDGGEQMHTSNKPECVGSLPAVWAAELQTWCSQVMRRYRVRMWHSVESAVSSTDAAGMLHTAIPVGAESRKVRSEGDPADVCRVSRCRR